MQIRQKTISTAIAIAKAKLKRQTERISTQARRTRRQRNIWVRQWLQRRPELGQYARLMEELKAEDVKGFRNFLRMDPDLYQEILTRIEPRIKPKPNNFRVPLSAGIKLAITLRYLASGESYHSLMYGFRVAHNTISKVIRQVCAAIVEEYSAELIPCPATPDDWKKIAKEFGHRWNLHHCVGALDGKHIAIQCPARAGSMYYNYKGYHSLILMALVDADYKFLWAEVGSNGSAGDAQVFNNSELKEAIEKKVLGLPEAEPLPNDDKPMPFYIAADDAFALKTWLMKPFSKKNLSKSERIFNYRLSRGRRIVENAFGILAHRFRCLLTTMLQHPETVTSIVTTCLCLHNLLRMRYRTEHITNVADQEDDDHTVIPGEWRKDNPLLDGVSDLPHNSTTKAAKNQREYFCAYMNSEAGSVSWQDDMI